MLLCYPPVLDADSRPVTTIGEACNVARRVQRICHTQLRINTYASVVIARQTRDRISCRLDAEPHQSQIRRNLFACVQRDAI